MCAKSNLFLSFLFIHSRFNLTNTEEPYFLVESLEALNSIDDINDRSYRVVVYSVNQKGRSPKIVLKDFVIGDRDHHASGMWFHYDDWKNIRTHLFKIEQSMPQSLNGLAQPFSVTSYFFPLRFSLFHSTQLLIMEHCNYRQYFSVFW